MARGSLNTNPGSGPGIETVELPGGVVVPTTVMRGMRDSVPVDVAVDDEGGVLVSRDLAYEIANALREVPPYARDVNDQLRASVGTPSVYVGWGDNGSISTVWYRNPGGPTSMDAREVHREQSVSYTNARVDNWTFS